MSQSAPPPPEGYPEIVLLDRANVLLRISLGLNTRSDRRWRVRGGTGLDRGQITLSSPADRLDGDGQMPMTERELLAGLLGLDGPVGPAGYLVEDSYDHYREAIDRAEGRPPRVIAEPLPWA